MARRILIVEDDADQRIGLAELLRAHGYAVSEASSAEEAISLLASASIDLVVADYDLGGATGAWLARIAARTGGGSSPRAILITGHDALLDADGLTVLRKPLDVDRFLAMVDRAVEQPASGGGQPPGQRIVLVHYLTDSHASRRAHQALAGVLAQYDASQVALSVVRLSAETGSQAEAHRVVVTPTLLRTFPPPCVWVTGDLDPPAIVERLLQQAGVESRRV